MHRSFSFRSLLAVAVVACAAVAERTHEYVVAPVMEAITAVKRTLARWARAALSLFSAEGWDGIRQVRVFAAARSFYLRIVRRDRPTVTPTWRMCPST